MSFARVDRLDANTSVLLVDCDVCSQLIMPLNGPTSDEDKGASTGVNVCQTQTAQRKLLGKVQKTRKKVIFIFQFSFPPVSSSTTFPIAQFVQFSFQFDGARLRSQSHA